MPSTETVIVGAGQAGLAASYCLTSRHVDHVVLDRGRVGERWRHERWDSLRLLTANWMNRLPGWRYTGPDPGGYLTAAEFTDFLAAYALAAGAPVHEQRSIIAITGTSAGFEVVTTDGTWRAGNVVLATGWSDLPAIPAVAAGLDRSITQVTPATYRRPSRLPAGGVLVVGASATGVQLASELAEDGRQVVLAVGSHSRLPRRYRGMDSYWWLERLGRLDQTIDQVPDPVAARHEPSLQLVGRPDQRTLDLATVAADGVELAGRLVRADGGRVAFAGDLAATVTAADDRLRRLLAEVDAHIDAHGLAAEVLAPEPVRPVPLEGEVHALDLRARGITTVIWATGYRRAYPWLQLPVLDPEGEIRQRRGVTPVPGLYVLGQRFQHFRSSNFIHGVGRDAAFVADHVAHRLATQARP